MSRRTNTTLKPWSAYALLGTTMLLAAGNAMGQARTNAPVIGNIQDLTVIDSTDRYSAGIITVGGQEIIIPRNLLIDLPANRLTLAEMFELAPGNCLTNNQSGLAESDSCGRAVVGVASILANRISPTGPIVAGEVFIEKGQEGLVGVVTFVNYNQGYIRVGGLLNNDSGGALVRINDPDARHTIQRGPGCQPGNGTAANCSADVRFGLDPDNYTITSTTGYPMCIPSRKDSVTDPGDDRVVNRTRDANGFTRANANGRNDTFCPHRNRTVNNGRPVEDSFRFAPIQVGDHMSAEGNFERVRGTRFLSPHTLTIHQGLTTSQGQPDYIIFDEAEWDVAGYQNQRIIQLLIGFTTLGGSDVEVYGLHVNPTNGENEEVLLASTVGCDIVDGAGSCTSQGVPPAGNDIFKFRYDVDFLDGNDQREDRTPCAQLNAAQLNAPAGLPLVSPCNLGTSIQDHVRALIPPTREVIARSRNKVLNEILDSIDIKGEASPNGEYLTPVGMGHPEFVEINLDAVQTPFIFAGQNWLLDRRLGPNGCAEGVDCSGDADVALSQFPASCLDPAGQTGGLAPGGINFFRDRILSYLGNGGGSLDLNVAGPCP